MNECGGVKKGLLGCTFGNEIRHKLFEVQQLEKLFFCHDRVFVSSLLKHSVRDSSEVQERA